MGLFCINKITSWYSPSLLEALGNKSNLKPAQKITFGHFKMRVHVFTISLYSAPPPKKKPVLHRNHIYPLQTKLWYMCTRYASFLIERLFTSLSLSSWGYLLSSLFCWLWIKIVHIDLPSASCNQWYMTFTAYCMAFWE